MTRQETAAVLALMTAAWPRQPVTDATVAVWGDALRDLVAEDALTAAKALIANEEFFPSVTKFRSTATALARRRLMAHAHERGLPEGERVPNDRGRQLAAEARARLHGRTEA